MQEVFEKLKKRIRLCATEACGYTPLTRVVSEAELKKIIEQIAAEYSNGHFGCNTNGEHERCDGCGLTDCKSRNKIWFGVGDDAPDTNVGSNGWIPCGSGVMPRANGWYLVTNHLGVVQEQRWSANHWEKLRDDAVLAWRELPSPYQPKGE